MPDISYDSFIGGTNTTNEITSPNSDFTNLFSVKNSYTYDVKVLGIQTRFKAGLHDCRVKFKDGDGNEIISGSPLLSNIGNSYDAAIGFNTDLLPVDFILPTGNEIFILLANRIQPVNKLDISLLFCVKRVLSQRNNGSSIVGMKPTNQVKRIA
jgi:hypothetical protein